MNSSRRGEGLPCDSIRYFGNCFTRCFKRNERRLTSEKPTWKRWKMNGRLSFCGDIDLFFALQCIGFAWIWTTASEWKLASQDPILSLLMKKPDGNNFYNLKLRLPRKSSRNRRVVSGLFLAHGAANLHMCAWLLNSLLNRNLLFSWINLDVNNLRNQNINHWKENFGKSVWQRERKRILIT